MIKRILSLFLVIILLFNLFGCSTNNIDFEKVALDYINGAIKNGDGFLPQLENRSKLYNQILDKLINKSIITENERTKFLNTWKSNYDKYKGWFDNNNTTNYIGKNDKFLTNVTWILSPTTLACLYNYYQILKTINSHVDKFDDKSSYPYIVSITPNEWKPILDGQNACHVSEVPGAYIFTNFIKKENITSVAAIDKIPKILETLKINNNSLSKEINGDTNENPWFSRTTVVGNDISGGTFETDGSSLAKELSKDNKIKNFKGAGMPAVGLGKELDDAKNSLAFPYKNDEDLTKQFNILTDNLSKAGFCGVVFIEEDIKTWYDTPNDPDSKHTRISRTLNWDLAPFIIFDGSTIGSRNGKAFQLETFPALFSNTPQIIDFVSNDETKVNNIISQNSTIRGLPTIQGRISSTGESDEDIKISSKVFQYQEDTITSIVDQFKDYRSQQDKTSSKAKYTAYNILTQFVDGENIETDQMFRSTKAGEFVKNLTFKNIFQTMIDNKIDSSWNQYNNDWIFTINSIPFMSVRAYQLRQDADEHLQDSVNEAKSKDDSILDMQYQKEGDKNIQGKAVINTKINIDVIDKISDSGFTTTDSSGLYFDLYKDISEQTKTGLIKPSDNDIENGIIKQNYNDFNNSYWKAPNGHMLLTKYYATYDIGQINNTEGNQSWSGPTPIGRAIYLNTNNVNYDRENNIYTWKKPDQPVFYMADPSTNRYPSILNGMQIYLSDLGTGSLEGLDNSLEQELAVPDYSLLTRGGN